MKQRAAVHREIKQTFEVSDDDLEQMGTHFREEVMNAIEEVIGD